MPFQLVLGKGIEWLVGIDDVAVPHGLLLPQGLQLLLLPLLLLLLLILLSICCAKPDLNGLWPLFTLMLSVWNGLKKLFPPSVPLLLDSQPFAGMKKEV